MMLKPSVESVLQFKQLALKSELPEWFAEQGHTC